MRGAVTHGPTINADNDPIIPTPTYVPDFFSFDLEMSKFCINLGICRVIILNIDRDKIINNIAKPDKTYGF